MRVPDPFREIRLVSLRTVRGANFWSRSPVTRLDLEVGAFDEISSADAEGVTDSLVAALPSLIEHRCSIGERGGFVTRLRRGTYAPHIVEHLALELQGLIGHAVGFGRARGGDRAGEYTVVFHHVHAEVGLRAAAHALDLVQRAFAGRPLPVRGALEELRRLAGEPDVPGPAAHVVCGMTGGGDRSEARERLAARLGGDAAVIDVSASYLLNAGLPYARSRTAVVLDSEISDVPERYRAPDQAQRLVSVVADAVPCGGVVIVAAREREVQAIIREMGRRVALFAGDEPVSDEDARSAFAVARLRGDRILVEHGSEILERGTVDRGGSAPAQLAAALADFCLEVEQP